MSVDAILSRINVIQSSIGSLSASNRPSSQMILGSNLDTFTNGDTDSAAFQEVMARAAAGSAPATSTTPPATVPDPSTLTSALDPTSQNALSRQMLETIAAQSTTPALTAPSTTPALNVPAAPPNAAVSPAPTKTPVAAVAAPERATPIEAPAKKPQASSGASAGGDEVVRIAKKYLGVPYVWGGNNPRIGLDCSGLVKLVFKEMGYDLPRVARQQAQEGREIASVSQAQPGDLIGMRKGKHIAIYLGDNKILHAPQPGEKVSIRSLHSRDVIDTIRRITS